MTSLVDDFLLDMRRTMTDPGVQLVREWLQRQPFSLRILTLMLFMVEAMQKQTELT